MPHNKAFTVPSKLAVYGERRQQIVVALPNTTTILEETMNIFSYPLDLFTAALALLTLFTVAAIVKQEGLSRSQKYLALCLTFFTTGTLGLVALYSLGLCVGLCFILAVLCSVLYCKACREDQRKHLMLTYDGSSLIQPHERSGYLPADSNRRVRQGIRLLSGGHG